MKSVDEPHSNWPLVRFGDVVRNVNENVRDPLDSGLERFVGLEHIDPESLHIKRWGLIEEGTTFTRKFVKGQVLFGKRRAYQRKVAVAEFDGICSGDILVFEPANVELLPELLPFIVQSDGFFEHALGTSAGSLSPRTKWQDLARYEFALPPKDEQRRIAEILWAADESIIKTLDVISALQSYRLSYMRSVFGMSLNGAQLVPLSELLVYASDGPFGSKLKTEHYTENGARVIRLQNVGDGQFNDEDKAYISQKYYKELSRYALYPGDIVVAGLGDETHAVGRACQISPNIGPAINKADCFCLRADTSRIEQEYLLHFLNSPNARLQVNQRVQGTTRFRINVSNLKAISVLLPEREKQLQVVHVFRSLNQATSAAQADLQSKRRMMSILRDRLLAGEGVLDV